ncbi:MAG TPA: sulfite reductase [Rhabdochlamydiaceae bacterium]|nr:sulfite reductase [Rhabdochlamydiaceae bacterium]
MDISEITIEEKSASIISRSNPFGSTVKERFALTKPGSSKTTYHISLDLRNSGLQFQAGDSIGVLAQNDPILVQHLIDAMKAEGDQQIVDPKSKENISLRDFLTFRANLSRLTSSFLKLLNSYNLGKKARLNELLLQENKAKLSAFLSAHDPLDLLKEYHEVQAPLQELCSQFGPLLPRFYSAASSPKSLPDEVHLTVALFSYTHSGEKRYGVASHFLCHLCEQQKTQVPIYVQPAHCFSLPSDLNVPIIMIGPGTGIAPFRAFLQERVHLEAKGKNWLFFGERNRAYDFFYEDFFTELANKGTLRFDVAFSRDQAEKLYVQHKLYENASELWALIQEGAYLYVCGDAQEMAKDVESILRRIAIEQGNLSEDDAKAYLKKLRTEKRYQLDVY